jgi:hypothetical protein
VINEKRGRHPGCCQTTEFVTAQTEHSPCAIGEGNLRRSRRDSPPCDPCDPPTIRDRPGRENQEPGHAPSKNRPHHTDRAARIASLSPQIPVPKSYVPPRTSHFSVMATNPSVTAGATPPARDNDSSGQGPSRGGRRRDRSRDRGNHNRNGSAGRGSGPRNPPPQTFFGNTDGMNKNVFQTPAENVNKQQFLKTVGVLNQHINKTFEHPKDVASACESFTVTVIPQPASLSPIVCATDMGAKMIWETEMKSFMKRRDKMESNLRAIFSIIWGQCAPLMQSKLESIADYDLKSVDCDCCWLLKETQGITHCFEGKRNVFISLDNAWSDCYSFRQGRNKDPHEHLKEQQALVQVLDRHGAAIGSAGPHVASVIASVTADWAAKNDSTPLLQEDLSALATAAAKTKVIAVGFLKRSDTKRHGGLWTDLENSFSRGTGDYSKDLTEAFALLLACCKPPPSQQPGRADNEDVSGHTFLLQNALVAGSDGETHQSAKCHNCNRFGHFSIQCPDRRATDAVQLLQVKESSDDYVSAFTFLNILGDADPDIVLAQAGPNIIPSTWMLLDSQSTCSVFKDRKLLTNVRDSPRTLRVYTNGGTQTSTKIGNVKNLATHGLIPTPLPTS